MSFKEISTWVLLILFGWLGLLYAAPLFEAQSLDVGSPKNMILFVFGFIGLYVTAHIALAIFLPKKSEEVEDERDKRIELFGDRIGGVILGVFAISGAIYAIHSGDLVYANIFFLGLIASEMAKAVWQILLYRRGV